MPRHLTVNDEFEDPTGIMTGPLQEPVIDLAAAKAAMGLSTVASTGSYADLTGTPTIPAAQTQADWSEANSAAADYVKNKPSIPAAQVQSDWTEASTSSIAFVKNKPLIPDAQVQTDWSQATTGSVDYIKNKPSIPSAQVQSDWTQITTGSVDYIKNKPSIPAAQVQSDWTQAGTGSVDYVKNKPLARSVAHPARTLNSAFQISSAQDASVSYSVDISASLSLVTGQVGTLYLRYADDSAHTTNVKEVGRSVNGNAGALTIGLALTQTATATLSGVVPLGKYAKIVTENTTGTPTFTFRSAQEVLL